MMVVADLVTFRALMGIALYAYLIIVRLRLAYVRPRRDELFSDYEHISIEDLDVLAKKLGIVVLDYAVFVDRRCNDFSPNFLGRVIGSLMRAAKCKPTAYEKLVKLVDFGRDFDEVRTLFYSPKEQQSFYDGFCARHPELEKQILAARQDFHHQMMGCRFEEEKKRTKAKILKKMGVKEETEAPVATEQ
jgi:hypothetical protein